MADADDGENAMFTENMPAPPPFWRFFTPENVKKVEKLKENNEAIPSDLSALVPPPVPEDGKYRSFGGSFNVTAHKYLFAPFTKANIDSFTNCYHLSKSYSRNDYIPHPLQHKQAMNKILENPKLHLIGH
jgi:MED7 protein